MPLRNASWRPGSWYVCILDFTRLFESLQGVSRECFIFNIQIDEKQDELLKTARKWQCVTYAGHLEPESTDAEHLRTCFLYVDPTGDVIGIVKRLKKAERVETASIPSARYAAAG